MVVLKYTYAWDETKTSLVHINDAQKGRVYYCLNPDCDERLSVREGEDRRKHYYHIKNGDKCSYDNYLHTQIVFITIEQPKLIRNIRV